MPRKPIRRQPAGAAFPLMAPHPPLRLSGRMCCGALGLGCLLWAVRDGAELLVGRGGALLFAGLAGLYSGCSAAGGLRRASARAVWPAGIWRRGCCRGTGLAWTVQPAVHRWPQVAACLLAPLAGDGETAVRLRKAPCPPPAAAAESAKGKKSEKSKKSAENQLQKPSTILYN